MSDEITSHRIPTSGSQPVPVPITLPAADFGTNNPADASSGRSTAARGGVLSALGGATACLNSEPLSAADLRGKIVLVEFWTYTCINWLRTLPYARAWADT